MLQTTGGGANPYRAAGTPEEWKHEVAALCVGNTRLVFSVSTAFASTLLEITRDESGGIHWRGPSSSGKTTIIEVACSVWGSPAPEAYLHRWRATINGLEAVAVLHNDTLLALDEVTQVDPREAGEAAYMLANGTGKHRANRYGGSRDTQTWRTLFLSSGELSLADHMQAAGKRALAGQETRLVDIAADTGIHGVFEDLHGYANGATFSHALRRVAHKYYGTAGREFLRKLVSSMESIAGQIAELRQDFIAEHVPENASGQVERVAQRFAFVAAGGELATALGITGWPEGEAIKSAVACFRGWLNTRGGGEQSGRRKSIVASLPVLPAPRRKQIYTLGVPEV